MGFQSGERGVRAIKACAGRGGRGENTTGRLRCEMRRWFGVWAKEECERKEYQKTAGGKGECGQLEKGVDPTEKKKGEREVSTTKRPQTTTHFSTFFLIVPSVRPLIASFNAKSNTSSTPVPLIALTSAYRAPILRATADPSASVTG
jgi:hypothetical protein